MRCEECMEKRRLFVEIIILITVGTYLGEPYSGEWSHSHLYLAWPARGKIRGHELQQGGVSLP